MPLLEGIQNSWLAQLCMRGTGPNSVPRVKWAAAGLGSAASCVLCILVACMVPLHSLVAVRGIARTTRASSILGRLALHGVGTIAPAWQGTGKNSS